MFWGVVTMVLAAAWAFAAESAAAVESVAAVFSLPPDPHEVWRITTPTQNTALLNLESFIDFKFRIFKTH
jgi:hypothetical protein